MISLLLDILHPSPPHSHSTETSEAIQERRIHEYVGSHKYIQVTANSHIDGKHAGPLFLQHLEGLELLPEDRKGTDMSSYEMRYSFSARKVYDEPIPEKRRFRHLSEFTPLFDQFHVTDPSVVNRMIGHKEVVCWQRTRQVRTVIPIAGSVNRAAIIPL